MSRVPIRRLWPAAALASVILYAQGPGTSIWDGVYTDAQATRGEAVYKAQCASCHGVTLEGRGQIPPLAGDEFLTAWDGMTLADLFEKQQTSMPADRPGQLTPTQNADILAYLLKMSKAPSGTQELPADGGKLRGIRASAAPPTKK